MNSFPRSATKVRHNVTNPTSHNPLKSSVIAQVMFLRSNLKSCEWVLQDRSDPYFGITKFARRGVFDTKAKEQLIREMDESHLECVSLGSAPRVKYPWSSIVQIWKESQQTILGCWCAKFTFCDDLAVEMGRGGG